MMSSTIHMHKAPLIALHCTAFPTLKPFLSNSIQFSLCGGERNKVGEHRAVQP